MAKKNKIGGNQNRRLRGNKHNSVQRDGFVFFRHTAFEIKQKFSWDFVALKMYKKFLKQTIKRSIC